MTLYHWITSRLDGYVRGEKVATTAIPPKQALSFAVLISERALQVGSNR